MSRILSEMEALLAGLTPEDRARLESLADDERRQPWVPNPGPQTAAYLSRADVLLYGGAAGGGKSDLLCGSAVRDHARALILRRQGVELDGIESRLDEILSGTGARWNGQKREWRLGGGRVIKMGGCKQVNDWRAYAGRPRDFMGFDEAGEFAEEQPSSLVAWLRSTDAGQRCRVILASNPPRGGEGMWLLTWFAPWLDPLFADAATPGERRWAVRYAGEHLWVGGPGPVKEHPMTGESLGPEPLIPLSYTFIPARLDDNPYLADDAGYRARLMSLAEPLRSQLLYGDFLAGREDAEWQVIPSDWVRAAQARWARADRTRRRAMLAMGIDVAQGGPDTTVIAALHAGNLFAELEIRKGEATPDGPAVAQFVLQHRRDRALPVIDLTGGWGISARDHLEGQHGIGCETVIASEASGARSRHGDFGFLNLRAEMWWTFREALDPESAEGVALPPDPRLAAELCAPVWELRKDRIKVESKEELKKRLGASTDRADAVLMAWLKREEAAMTAAGRRRPAYAKPENDPLASSSDLPATSEPGRDPFDG